MLYKDTCRYKLQRYNLKKHIIFNNSKILQFLTLNLVDNFLSELN